MMQDIEARLLQALQAPHSALELERVCESLRASGDDISAVTAVLHVMEQHPEHDFGSPGPLVHFAEEFYRRGYESELLASLERQPTSHTVWMLNRILNGTPPGAEYDKYVAALRAAAAHPAATEETRQSVESFLADLGG